MALAHTEVVVSKNRLGKVRPHFIIDRKLPTRLAGLLIAARFAAAMSRMHTGLDSLATRAFLRRLELVPHCPVQSLLETIPDFTVARREDLIGDYLCAKPVGNDPRFHHPRKEINRPNLGRIFEAHNLEQHRQDFGSSAIRDTWCGESVTFDGGEIPETGKKRLNKSW